MSLSVKKPFTTALQRFKEGDEIADGVDLFPHTVESLTDAGYLAPPPPVKISAKPKTDDKPADEKPTE